MPNQILPVTGLDTVGIIKDTPPSALPPQAFSDAQNVRFRDGAALKMEGEVSLFFGDSDSEFYHVMDSDTQIKYVAWWPNPNLTTEHSGYYLVIAEKTDPTLMRRRDFAYIMKPGGKLYEKGSFQPDAEGNWQHTLFQGGFAIVINNGQDKPHYILDSDGNTDPNAVPDFAVLPGWDSYNITQTALDDVFQVGNSHTFDLGQKIDFAIDSIVVSRVNPGTAANPDITEDVFNAIAGTPAGTGTPNDTDFVPGNLPAEVPAVTTDTDFAIYTDTETNTTVIQLSNTTVVPGRHIRVVIRSRREAAIRCGVIRAFGDFLVAGDLREVEAETVQQDVIIRSLPGAIRTSDVAAPGAIPNNWDPNAAGVSTANEFQTTQGGIVQDMVQLQGQLYIYSNDGIYVMPNPGGGAPSQPQPVADGWGCQTTNAVIEFDGTHFVVGAQDIYLFSGHPGNIQSVADGRIREYFFQNLNPLHEQRMFCLRNRQKDEIWVCYPTKDSITGECDEAVIWNYRKNTWAIRTLESVVAGDVGPVPGGGIPTLDVHLNGDSGNSGIATLGARDIQSIHMDPAESLPGDDLIGRPTEYTITVAETIPEYSTGSHGAIFDFVLRGFSSGTNNPLYFYAIGFDTDDNIRFEYERQLGADLITAVQVHDFLEQDSEFRTLMNAVAPTDTELFIEFLDSEAVNGQVSFGVRRVFSRANLTRDSEFDITPGADQTMSSNDTECVLNGAIYVDLDDVGNYYFPSVTGFDPLPAGFRFEILSGIGDGDTEYFYDGHSGANPNLNLMYGLNRLVPGSNPPMNDQPRGGLTGRPYANGTTPPQFMYRYRADSADRAQQQPDPWVPQFSGLYQVRITVPRADSDTDCPGANDWKLDAYVAPNNSTDGTPSVSIQDLNRSQVPSTILPDGTIESAAPVLQFDMYRDVYDSATDTEVQDPTTLSRVFSTIGGNFSGLDAITRASHIAEHIAHDFHDSANNPQWNANDTGNVVGMITRTSGSYHLALTGIGGTTHGVSLDDFLVHRTQKGFWPHATDITGLGPDVIQAVYPTIQVEIDAGVGQRVREEVSFTLTNINTNKADAITPTQIMSQFLAPMSMGAWDHTPVPLTLNGYVENPANTVAVFTVDDTEVTAGYRAERRVDSMWSAEVTAYGNLSLKEVDGRNWRPEFQNPWITDAATTVDFRGQWQQRATPTYMALLISNTSNTMLYPDGLELILLRAGTNGDYNVDVQSQQGTNGVSLNNEQAAEKWVEDIRLYNPRLSALDRGTDGQFIVQPANYGDSSQFVLDSATNDTQAGADLINMWAGFMNGTDAEYGLAAPDPAVPDRRVGLNPNTTTVVRNYHPTSGVLQDLDVASSAPAPTADLSWTQFNDGTSIRVPSLTSEATAAPLQNTVVPTEDSKVFDIDRPWGANEVNYNLQFPIFATLKILGQDYRANKVVGADIGWTRPAYADIARTDSFPGIGVNRVITGNDTPLNYRSYAERIELPITPEFETETISSVAMLADGFYKPGFFDSDVYNQLEITAYGTNAPGAREMRRVITNNFFLSEDYKMDIRTEGRFINISIGDVTASTTYEGKTYQQNANWRVNGIQLEIMKGGQR